MTAALLLGFGWAVMVAVPLVMRAGDATSRRRLGPLRPGRHADRRRADGRRVCVSYLARWLSRAGVVFALVGRARSALRSRDTSREVARGLPLALDVLTMAARAGCTVRLAIGVAATWSPPAVAGSLGRVEQRCRLGSSLGDALAELGREEPALRTVTDALLVSERSGAPTADLLARLADDARAALRRRSEEHARRVPVRILFPLVFLVLPAFGLLTVVPALASGLRHP